MENYKESPYLKAYIAGYRDGVADAYSGKVKNPHSSDPHDLPVSIMGLSTRASNCLIRSGCRSVADVLSLDEDTVRKMRNLGPKTAAEIAHWLVEHYYFSSTWVQYL